MKKILLFLSVVCAASILSGCENRLDIEQKGVISADDFYKTDADAENALNNLYQCFCLHIAGNEGIYVAMPVLFNEAGDDMLAAGNMYGDNDFGAQINEFRYDSQNDVIKNTYSGLYAVVYDSNLILDKIADDTQVKKRVRAEARALRAWAHLMLAIGWNCPPLVDHILPGDAKPTNYEGGHDGLLEWVAQEAEAAVADLDERVNPTDKVGASKVTKGFALTVAGKAHLFRGDYAQAKADLKQVINSGKYELVPADRWPNLFHASGDLCEEMIFQANCLDNANVGDWANKIQRTSWMWIQFWNWRTDKLASKPSFIGPDGWGGHSIRKDFAEKMLANDGDSPRRKATFMTGDEFLYEMDWNGEGVGTVPDSRAERETSPLIGIKASDGLYGFDGYFAHKIVAWPEDNEKGWYGFKNLTIFRYAEVLLMYAEACAMTNDNDGLKYLNDIQNRAGSAHISTTLNMTEVKNEKMFEMWIEGVRFPDMVRWGETDGVVNNGKDIPSTYDAYFTKGEAKHRLYVEKSNPNVGQTGFVKGKHEYFAYPYDVVSRNPNLIQNPSGL